LFYWWEAIPSRESLYIWRRNGWVSWALIICISLLLLASKPEFNKSFTYLAHTVTPTLARILGRYCLLNGVIMTHCAVCIHHVPMISLSICSLSLSIMLYGSEAFYYYTTPVNFYVLFPILISGTHCGWFWWYSAVSSPITN
jgi:hypothetical protein